MAIIFVAPGCIGDDNRGAGLQSGFDFPRRSLHSYFHTFVHSYIPHSYFPHSYIPLSTFAHSHIPLSTFVHSTFIHSYRRLQQSTPVGTPAQACCGPEKIAGRAVLDDPALSPPWTFLPACFPRVRVKVAQGQSVAQQVRSMTSGP